ncbi:sulfatase-like hydrolase/transferase [uncultured Campylobacter sp.]|uniref:sulfatase-like hydrolase/transferase n=1 Tax=uncultured Campylobacter sp. TaxID=218934 RepID=UPI00262BC022|nr:sulfatase-like hydrolase/transferase [uncultured Campylobacter sp.]
MREKFYVALANIGELAAQTKAGGLIARLLMKIDRGFFTALRERPVWRVFWLATVLCLLACWAKIHYQINGPIFAYIAESFPVVFIINLLIFHLCYLLSGRFFKLVSFVLLALIALIASTSLFLIVNFDSSFNVVAIDAIVHTDAAETREFVSQFLNPATILYLAALLGCIFAALRAGRREKEQAHSRLRLLLAALYLIYGSIFCADIAVKAFQGKRGFVTKLSQYVPLEFAFTLKDYLSDKNFITDMHEVQLGYDEAKRANEGVLKGGANSDPQGAASGSASENSAPASNAQAQNSSVNLNSTPQSPSTISNSKNPEAATNPALQKSRVKNIILIIGESLQRGHMSLYGYGVKNTPLLEGLEASGNLIKFGDTISPYGTTNQVLMRLLNFSDYESERKRAWFRNLSIIDMFKLSGYRTFWISNQEAFGAHALSAKSAADRADAESFLSKSNLYETVRIKPDGVLLPLINQAKTEQSERNFYVIHLIGSHMDYSLRYPEGFGKFSAADVKAKLTSKQKDVVAYYDNSVLYNDFVINEIFKIFSGDDSLIVYLSDHGENLYENGRLGHGMESRFTYEIPLLFIASREFLSDHAKLWQRLAAAKDKPFMSDDLAHLLADIIGVAPLEFDEHKSPIRADFNASRKRIANGVDYDEKLKSAKGYEFE